ncbi:MAG: hypothetical protein J6Q84_04485, partial [Kiritimatiellae bacterium]|nr:hypothetical protein [Kiritimatiellia bacterium]
MAIKVKHEGNVTSRIYAAAAGGKGKRQAEDAKVLLAAQQRGNGGGGGTGGGARAGGSAPTMGAPTSHATLGSTGQMLSPPSMSFNQRTQLQAQQDEAAKDRLITEQEWRAGQRKLDREHQTELQESQQEWVSNQQRSKERREMRRDALRRQGYSDEAIMEIEEIEGEKTRIMQDRSLTPEQLADAMINLEEARERIVPQYEPTPDPNDPAQSIRDVTLSDGRKVQMIRDARGNWTEYIPDRTKLTAQEIFDSGVDYNGVRYVPDGRGGLTPLESRLQYATQNRNANQEAKLAQKAWDKYQNFVEKFIEKEHEASQDESNLKKYGKFNRDAAAKAADEAYKAIYGEIPTDPNETFTSTSTSTSNPEEG